MKVTFFQLRLIRIWISLFAVVGILFLPAMLLTAVSDLTFGLFFVLFNLVWYLILYLCFTRCPVIEMTEEGVFVRVLFRRRFYPWTDIFQAGVLWYPGWAYCNRLVLLPRGGSPRRHRDKTFVFRNLFRLIWIPQCTPKVMDYIRIHYGPLDFDCSDNRRQ